MFTQQHYKAIAKFMNGQKSRFCRVWLFKKWCKFFREDNPKFNEEKFAKAYFKEVEYDECYVAERIDEESETA